MSSKKPRLNLMLTATMTSKVDKLHKTHFQNLSYTALLRVLIQRGLTSKQKE